MERLEALLRAQTGVTASTTASSSARSTDAAGARSEADEEVCPICEGARFVRVTADPRDERFGQPVPCVCVRAEDLRARQERLLRYSRLGSLERFTFATLQPRGRSTDRVAQERYALAVEAAKRFADVPHGWLVLTGVTGSGKTHLAAAIANYNIEWGRPALFLSVADLLDQLRASYADDAEVPYERLLEQIRSAPLAIFDDLDAYSATPWAREKFYQVVSHRFHAALPTVFTCDRAPEEIDPRLGARLTDPALAQVFVLAERELPRYSFIGAVSRDRLAGFTFAGFRPGGKSVRNRDASLEGALREATKWAEHPEGWLVLLGGTGRGKTHLAGAIANYCLDAGYTVCFANVPDLLDRLRASYGADATQSYEDIFTRLRETPVLILDDFGAEQGTAWAQEKLYQLLNYRYESRLATVITSNLSVTSFDPRIASRLFDLRSTLVYEIDAPDYRIG